MGGHPSTTYVAARLQRPTRVLGRAALERTLSGLAPGGVYLAATVARRAGGLLHHRFTLTRPRTGGLLSVALSRGSPRVGVTHHLALRSPDVPRCTRGATRPPDRLIRLAIVPSCGAAPDTGCDVGHDGRLAPGSARRWRLGWARADPASPVRGQDRPIFWPVCRPARPRPRRACSCTAQGARRTRGGVGSGRRS